MGKTAYRGLLGMFLTSLTSPPPLSTLERGQEPSGSFHIGGRGDNTTSLESSFRKLVVRQKGKQKCNIFYEKRVYDARTKTEIPGGVD